MNYDMFIERTIRARNSLGELTVSGITQARNLVKVYDYLTETASLAEVERRKEEQAVKSATVQEVK